MGNKNSLKNEKPCSNVRMQVGLVSPQTVPGKLVTAYPQQPYPLLKSHIGDVLPQSDDGL